MSVPRVRVIIQARMSSRRFPGKMLAPFKGQPLIRQVVAAVERAAPSVPLIVATSEDPTDDPLAQYLAGTGTPVFRGPLDDVVERFHQCVLAHPCEWFLRVCGDSPLLDARVLRAVLDRAEEAWDIVTTLFPRRVANGHNAELVRVETFQSILGRALTPHDREHVTPYFYSHAEQFKIFNLDPGNPELSQRSLVVDTIEDLLRLEQVTEEELRQLPYNALQPASL